jgi:hypothetical protein
MKKIILPSMYGLDFIAFHGLSNAPQVIAKGSWEAIAADGTALGSYKTSGACVAGIQTTFHAAVTEAKALQGTTR